MLLWTACKSLSKTAISGPAQQGHLEWGETNGGCLLCLEAAAEESNSQIQGTASERPPATLGSSKHPWELFEQTHGKHMHHTREWRPRFSSPHNCWGQIQIW